MKELQLGVNNLERECSTWGGNFSIYIETPTAGTLHNLGTYMTDFIVVARPCCAVESCGEILSGRRVVLCGAVSNFQASFS